VAGHVARMSDDRRAKLGAGGKEGKTKEELAGDPIRHGSMLSMR